MLCVQVALFFRRLVPVLNGRISYYHIRTHKGTKYLPDGTSPVHQQTLTCPYCHYFLKIGNDGQLDITTGAWGANFLDYSGGDIRTGSLGLQTAWQKEGAAYCP